MIAEAPAANPHTSIAPLQTLPSLEVLRAELSRRSLATFFRHGWHVLEPETPLDDNWHIDAVCLHLQAMYEGWKRKKIEIDYVQLLQNLIINIPPGTAKSRMASVFFPAWVWLDTPSFRWIFLSAASDVSTRDSMYCRELIESEWYQGWFQPDWQLSRGQTGKTLFYNTKGGFRSSAGYGGRITGNRADAIGVDDPNDAEEVFSDPIRIGVTTRWDTAIGNRVNDARRSIRFIIMQRLHDGDLSGHNLTRTDWHHLNIQMEYEKDNGCKCADCKAGHTPIGWSDPRKEEGELLFPLRFPRNVLASELVRLGSLGYAGQMQQRPSPTEGGIIKRHWWRYWKPKGLKLPPVAIRMADGSDLLIEAIDLPDDLEEMAQSWDMTFKDTKGSDFVAGLVGGRKAANGYVLDLVHGRMDFIATCDALVDLSAKWPKTKAKYVEDKANGSAVISALRNKVQGLIAIEPEGGKVARTYAASPLVEAGNWYVPHPLLYPWVDEFLGEITMFPNGNNDDRLDSWTQLCARWMQHWGTKTRFRPI